MAMTWPRSEMGRHALGAVAASAAGILTMILLLSSLFFQSPEQVAYVTYFAFVLLFVPGCIVAWFAGLAASYALSRRHSTIMRRALFPIAGAVVGGVIAMLLAREVDVRAIALGAGPGLLASLAYVSAAGIGNDGRGRTGIGWWEERGA
ncbi:MAG TPA: hypothetical protein VJR92_01755 [Gemmatimonadaceae bacterium]|nr:hypothetical protein [Gemmatimonadaceae bacterium]